ncbi:MAG: hypothetical protein HYV09_23940 [Deltaproteobacteria bacterium]|nr:hypothetical protein [Deltaproteobacteria bacterium]
MRFTFRRLAALSFAACSIAGVAPASAKKPAPSLGGSVQPFHIHGTVRTYASLSDQEAKAAGVFQPTCQAPAWYDGANCFVATPPAGSTPFIYENNLYVTTPTPGTCALGSWDGANCLVATAPPGTQGFVWAGNLYYSPISVYQERELPVDRLVELQVTCQQPVVVNHGSSSWPFEAVEWIDVVDTARVRTGTDGEYSASLSTSGCLLSGATKSFTLQISTPFSTVSQVVTVSGRPAKVSMRTPGNEWSVYRRAPFVDAAPLATANLATGRADLVLPTTGIYTLNVYDAPHAVAPDDRTWARRMGRMTAYPVIAVKGFDAANALTTKSFSWLMSYSCTFDNDPSCFANGHNAFAYMMQKGYSLWTVMMNGSDSIRSIAGYRDDYTDGQGYQSMALSRIIATRTRAMFPCYFRGVMLGGYSLGGQVARAGLTNWCSGRWRAGAYAPDNDDDETNGPRSNVFLPKGCSDVAGWWAGDSPHQGATIPRALQLYLNDPQNTSIPAATLASVRSDAAHELLDESIYPTTGSSGCNTGCFAPQTRHAYNETKTFPINGCVLSDSSTVPGCYATSTGPHRTRFMAFRGNDFPRRANGTLLRGVALSQGMLPNAPLAALPQTPLPDSKYIHYKEVDLGVLSVTATEASYSVTPPAGAALLFSNDLRVEIDAPWYLPDAWYRYHHYLFTAKNEHGAYNSFLDAFQQIPGQHPLTWPRDWNESMAYGSAVIGPASSWEAMLSAPGVDGHYSNGAGYTATGEWANNFDAAGTALKLGFHFNPGFMSSRTALDATAGLPNANWADYSWSTSDRAHVEVRNSFIEVPSTRMLLSWFHAVLKGNGVPTLDPSASPQVRMPRVANLVAGVPEITGDRIDNDGDEYVDDTLTGTPGYATCGNGPAGPVDVVGLAAAGVIPGGKGVPGVLGDYDVGYDGIAFVDRILLRLPSLDEEQIEGMLTGKVELNAEIVKAVASGSVAPPKAVDGSVVPESADAKDILLPAPLCTMEGAGTTRTWGKVAPIASYPEDAKVEATKDAAAMSTDGFTTKYDTKTEVIRYGK